MPTSTTKREWKDEYTLLCERCGYVIEGLDQSGKCPECGKPIVESLPERRVGTPWQQSPGVGSMLRTWWMTLRHPLRTLDEMQLRPIPLSRMVIKPLLLIALLFVTFGSAQILFIGEVFYLAFIIFPVFMGIASIIIMIMLGLTHIESLGLRTISRQRGFRITGVISNQIVACGAVGWAIALAGIGHFWNVYIMTVALGESTSLDLQSAARPVFSYGTITSLLLVVFGFLFFETFAYLGLRRLKYANRVRPETPDEPTTDSPRTT